MNEIEQLRQRFSHPEFIDYIKSHGKLIEHNVIGMPNNRYSEPVLMEYRGVYFIMYEVLATLHDEVYYYDEETFGNENQARMKYNSLLVSLSDNNAQNQ